MRGFRGALTAMGIGAVLLGALIAVVLPGLARAPAWAQTVSGVPCEALPPEAPGSCSGEPLDWRRISRISVVALLPTGREGRPYRSPVIRGGTPGYAFDLQQGLPPGLSVTSTGYLVGMPTKAGAYHVHIVAHDSSSPPRSVSADWSIRILAPARPPKPGPTPNPSPGPTPAPPAPPIGVVISYMLDAPALKTLDGEYLAIAASLPAPTEPASPAMAGPTSGAAATTGQRIALRSFSPGAPPPPPPVTPSMTTACQSPNPTGQTPAAPATSPQAPPSARLSPLLGVEYPDKTVFLSAVCNLMQDDPLARRGGPFASFLAVVAKIAERPHAYTSAPALTWRGQGGCTCVAPQPVGSDRTIYGFFPFWRSSADALPIDFSLMDRVGFLGVQGQSSGLWLKPVAPDGQRWPTNLADFAWVAKSHGVKFDLVLQRANWQGLSTDDKINYSNAVQSARNAASFLRLKLDDRGRWYRRFLFPFWKSPTYIFDGLTIFFTPPDTRDETLKKLYKGYYADFVIELLSQMKTFNRPLALNLVMTDAPFCTRAEAGREDTDDPCGAGPFSQGNIALYEASASPKSAQRELNHPDANGLSLRFLVLLRHPTQDTKKQLHASIDRLDQIGRPDLIHGASRALLLNSIAPVVFTPPPSTAPLDPSTLTRLQDDLNYFRDNYGGAGFWQLPYKVAKNNRATLDGTVRITLLPDYQRTVIEKFTPVIWIPWFCSSLARLFWQASVVAVIAGLLILALGNLSDAQIRSCQIFTIVAGMIAAFLGLILLQRDPALDRVSRDNAILLAMIVVFLVTIGILWVKPKVRDP